LFQGHTARQSSQPNTRLPIGARNSRGCGPCARSSGRRCSGAHRAGRARESLASGRCRGSGCSCRNGRPRARPAPAPPR
jgi:hypothetical protein